MARAERHFDSLHIPSICRLSFLTSTQSPPRLLKYSLNSEAGVLPKSVLAQLTVAGIVLVLSFMA